MYDPNGPKNFFNLDTPSLQLRAFDFVAVSGDVGDVEYELGAHHAEAVVFGSVLRDVGLKPFADFSSFIAFGSVLRNVKINDAWNTNGSIHKSVGGDFLVSATRGGDWSVGGAVFGDTAFEEVQGFQLNVGQLNDTEIDESDVTIVAQEIVGDFEAEKSEVEVYADFADDAFFEVNESYFEGRFGTVDDLIMVVDKSSGSLDVKEGQVDLFVFGSPFDAATGGAGDFVHYVESSGLVDTGAGGDHVDIDHSSMTVLLGAGDDYIHAESSRLTLNPGAGADQGLVSGGDSLINLARDGEVDNFFFDLKGGGSHTVVRDPFDELNVLTNSGLWSVEEVDMIDHNPGDGNVDLAGLSIEIYDDFSFGKG